MNKRIPRVKTKDVSMLRFAQIFEVETDSCLTGGRQCSRWVLLPISAAYTGKVSAPDKFRNQAKSSRHFNGYFLKCHFQVRILAPQPTSAVPVRHVRFGKIAPTSPALRGISARLCSPNFWLFEDLSGILLASLCSPNSNFQIANPETRFEPGRDWFDCVRY